MSAAIPATHRIARGDTLSELAQQFGTTVAALMHANPQIRDADLIYAGRTLVMPHTAAAGGGDAKPSGTPGGVSPSGPTPASADAVSGAYTVYSSGAHSVRTIGNASQLLPHHDYQRDRVQGVTLPCHDVVLQKNGSQSCAVPAPIAGEVVFAGPAGGLGNAVIIRDAQGNRVRMGHLASIDVRVGQQVAYGTDIGTQGSTGNSTGEHVHLSASEAVTTRWVNDLLDGRFDGAFRNPVRNAA